MATLKTTNYCEHGGTRRFGYGAQLCDSTDLGEYNAGSYGCAVLCKEHARAAKLALDDAHAAERENGMALAQMARDERAMMR